MALIVSKDDPKAVEHLTQAFLAACRREDAKALEDIADSIKHLGGDVSLNIRSGSAFANKAEQVFADAGLKNVLKFI